MFEERCVSAASLLTSAGIFYFHIYSSNGPVSPVYRWECHTDFCAYRVRSGVFSAYSGALYRADRERCFFAELWQTSEGMPWTLLRDEAAA